MEIIEDIKIIKRTWQEPVGQIKMGGRTRMIQRSAWKKLQIKIKGVWHDVRIVDEESDTDE